MDPLTRTSLLLGGLGGPLLTSRDAGRTWTSSAGPVGEISAIGAGTPADGEVEALVVAGTGVLRTIDDGNSAQLLL
jgi:photosystem II stability/assembly factor-like uncharacterized protein